MVSLKHSFSPKLPSYFFHPCKWMCCALCTGFFSLSFTLTSHFSFNSKFERGVGSCHISSTDSVNTAFISCPSCSHSLSCLLAAHTTKRKYEMIMKILPVVVLHNQFFFHMMLFFFLLQFGNASHDTLALIIIIITVVIVLYFYFCVFYPQFRSFTETHTKNTMHSMEYNWIFIYETIVVDETKWESVSSDERNGGICGAGNGCVTVFRWLLIVLVDWIKREYFDKIWWRMIWTHSQWVILFLSSINLHRHISV